MKNIFKIIAAAAAIACVCISCEKVNNNATIPVPDGCEAVDLGLSVLWASCNLGASTEADPGTYFAWGETKKKELYDWNEEGQYLWGAYSTSLPTYGMTKYVDSLVGGDGINILEPNDDAATKNWGGKWRMPTEAEFYELVDETKCEWTWDDERKGYIVKGLATMNSIFLPAAGLFDEDELKEKDLCGYYWSSEVNFLNCYSPVELMFDTDIFFVNFYFRKCGSSVRPVMEKE